MATNPTNELTCRCDPICSSTIGLEIQYNHVPFLGEKPSLKENPLLSAKGGHPTSPKRRRKAFRHRKSKKLRIQAGTKSEMTKGIGAVSAPKKCHYAKHIEYPSLYVGANHLRLRVYRSYSPDIDLSNLAEKNAEKRFWMEEVDEKDFPLRVRSPR